MTRTRLVVAIVALGVVLGLTGCSTSSSADARFDGLVAGERVYDRTGFSLDGAETDALDRRLESLRAETGADVVVYVRELDADPDETLDQVEALQQAWVAATGVDQDVAGAILINREPGTTDEARAGIFVGSRFDDGNVPSNEQEAIVEDALIPPLKDGDVAGSLNAGLDRLQSSIVNGPPVTALDRFADGPGSTWLPWTGLAVVLVAAVAAFSLYRRRPRPSLPPESPTTHRPDHRTDPAVATALVHRSNQASATSATVLALAADDAVAFEPDGKKHGKPTIRVRLLDESKARGEVPRAVWGRLAEHAVDGVVDHAALTKVASNTRSIGRVVEAELDARGWRAHGTGPVRWAFGGLALLGGAVMVGAAVVAAAGAPIMLVAAIPGGLLLVTGLIMTVAYPGLTAAGLDAARPWEAYRDGMKAAAKKDDTAVDLDSALPDIVALGLGSAYRKRLESGPELRAFTAPAGLPLAVDPSVVNWAAFTATFGASSSSATVSGGGAGGGGGAAGST
ncbi:MULTISPECIES: TPM domain-containing protein [Nocardiaceae]|uniref:TPM domain-containing protein n=1 Tax=Rhodococcoides kroppenstedtii TaxID=293050 RepID=A0ABS7NU23_9NOCA|nr:MULTISPECIES: TPM domain-containing protein [Rhodococcus]AMY20847.1 hypothetical protein A3Q40_03488 [Rhodococcus sp. PBTS 1]MBY6313465.1 TPM domain-containing protein [Rhodococcus kroppenstedtii]MBY6321529.1 TPM domain-containing protein [Rhodococcus kroppenstedtii]MBY6400227.1 TPM domain-containing protein [Rhodococcus kroppenstedtii]